MTRKVALFITSDLGRRSSLGEYRNNDFILYLVNSGDLCKTQMEMASRQLHVDICAQGQRQTGNTDLGSISINVGHGDPP